jgi:hypothetical protein
VKKRANKILIFFIIFLCGCKTSQIQHGQRVEKMRFGVPALFTLEVDYYKDLENKGPNSLTEEQQIAYWVSQGIDPKIMNNKLPEPQIKGNPNLMERD